MENTQLGMFLSCDKIVCKLSENLMECQLWRDCMQRELKIDGIYPISYVFELWQDCMQIELEFDGMSVVTRLFWQRELKIDETQLQVL